MKSLISIFTAASILCGCASTPNCTQEEQMQLTYENDRLVALYPIIVKRVERYQSAIADDAVRKYNAEYDSLAYRVEHINPICVNK
jgi:hypothetical protein